MSRASEVIEQLMGTCLSLADVLTDEEQNDTLLLAEIDQHIEECQTCNWWCECGEINENGDCQDCETDS